MTELHQCLSHQLILLTQGPIHELSAEKRIEGVENLSFFELVNICNAARIGWQFDDYCDFPLRIRCAYLAAEQQTSWVVSLWRSPLTFVWPGVPKDHWLGLIGAPSDDDRNGALYRWDCCYASQYFCNTVYVISHGLHSRPSFHISFTLLFVNHIP